VSALAGIVDFARLWLLPRGLSLTQRNAELREPRRVRFDDFPELSSSVFNPHPIALYDDLMGYYVPGPFDVARVEETIEALI
jgi:hypothetical protein